MGRTVETERRASERVAKNRSNRQNLPENNPKSPPPQTRGRTKEGVERLERLEQLGR